jgi:hypothetical protein
MAIYVVSPRLLPNGEFAAAWFDDERCLWDDERLHKPGVVANAWTPPRLRLLRPERGATGILYNPNAYAFSAGVCERIKLDGIEFLPIGVDAYGTFYLVHPVVKIEVPPQSSFRQAPPPSGNIVEFISFAPTYVSRLPLFSLMQPPDSAAGRAGLFTRDLFASYEGASVLRSSGGEFLEFREVGGA